VQPLCGSQDTLRHTPSLAPARADARVPKMVALFNYLAGDTQDVVSAA